MNCKRIFSMLVAGAAVFATPLLAGSTPEPLRNVQRIVFLGDSITQGGDYVTDFECWLLANGIQAEVLNLGLGSETASDLTEAENAGHKKKYRFPRPAVSQRLERVLAATKPDLLFACYGMNDGGSLPADDTGLKRFSAAIEQVRAAANKAGVKRVVICTPPVQDAKGNKAQSFYDENLGRYSAWLLSKKADGWDVVDIHGPMRQALDQGRAKKPAFLFAKDGIHPGREGHWLMAREILTQFCGAKLDGVSSVEALFSNPEKGKVIRDLVHGRMVMMHGAWMTKTGHTRPGVAGGPGAKPGLPLPEAEAKAAAIGKQMAEKLNSPN